MHLGMKFILSLYKIYISNNSEGAKALSPLGVFFFIYQYIYPGWAGYKKKTYSLPALGRKQNVQNK